MAIDVFVMRHGETEANVDQIMVGRGDSPFTRAGRRQPVEVARSLDGQSLSCIYCSPMERALRTASLVQATLPHPIPLRADTALAEIDAGEFTGLTFQELRRRVPGDAMLGEFRYPGGESWRDVQNRAVEFVLRLEVRHSDEAVLVVTHAGVIAGLVAAQLREPIERYIRTRFGHDFLGRLRVENGRFTTYDKIVGTVDSWL